jgi:hypothetical protein
VGCLWWHQWPHKWPFDAHVAGCWQRCLVGGASSLQFNFGAQQNTLPLCERARNAFYLKRVPWSLKALVGFEGKFQLSSAKESELEREEKAVQRTPGFVDTPAGSYLHTGGLGSVEAPCSGVPVVRRQYALTNKRPPRVSKARKQNQPTASPLSPGGVGNHQRS